MFIRRIKHRTGNISIAIIEKRNGKQRCVKTYPTKGAVTEADLCKLERTARSYIKELEGSSRTLFDTPSAEDVLYANFATILDYFSNSRIRIIGPELVYGTLYNAIGYNKIKSELFRDLVICRLSQPGSKLRTIEYINHSQGKNYSISTIYRFLDNLCFRKVKQAQNAPDKDIKAQVEEISFNQTKKVLGGQIEVVFYDMTTLYFEASDEDDLRKCGFSKDGKHHCPQIYLGLFVGMGGNPIGYDIFKGNIFEGDTFIPLLKSLEKKYDIAKPIVIADSGLLSKKNIASLESSNYEYIIGARLKNEVGTIKSKILNAGLENGDIKVIDKDSKTRLVISKTSSREKKDAFNRKKGLMKLEKQIISGKLTKSNINNRGYNKYLKLEGTVDISIDYSKFDQDAQWDGIKGYVTNTKLSAEDVIENYRNLWFIERAFRMNKTDLRVRPIYHRLYNRIEAHICICFTAYTILLELERVLKKEKSSITVYKTADISRRIYKIEIKNPMTKKFENRIIKNEEDLEQIELLKIIQNLG